MRAQSELERRILELVEPQATALGLEVVRIRVMGARRPILQIMAEKPDGSMDVEDCAKLSRRLSPVLDAADPIKEEYALEVSSPGIDRPLTRAGDFAKWVGHEARVEVEMPVDGRRRFHGTIAGEADGVLALDLKDGGRAEIPLGAMSKARLVLTDALIATARARGQIPEAAEDDFDEIRLEHAAASMALPLEAETDVGANDEDDEELQDQDASDDEVEPDVIDDEPGEAADPGDEIDEDDEPGLRRRGGDGSKEEE